ncbi:hypothetical protein ACHAWT_004657 [Skeletonema menzelii]
MFDSIYAVLHLIATQNWEIFRSAILSRPSLFGSGSLANDVSSCPQLHGMTLLHAVIRYDPPLDVIVEMIRLTPEMVAKDCLGRTPLHVAAGKQASASQIKILSQACPAACVVQDEEGKTPLHFACDSSCVLFEEDYHNESKKPPDHAAVMALLSSSTHAATLEDSEEMSPLEHAIISGASLKTVKLLQFATSKGMQLTYLGSVISSTTSLQPKVDFISSSFVYKRRTKKYRRRPIYLEEDSKSVI